MIYELVEFSNIKARLAEGWVPAPGFEPVYRHVSPLITQTHVWMVKGGE